MSSYFICPTCDERTSSNLASEPDLEEYPELECLDPNEMYCIHCITNMEDEIQSERRADAEYDGQPDEAQEWHDFDPDC